MPLKRRPVRRRQSNVERALHHINRKLDRVLRSLEFISVMEVGMAQELDDLTVQVQKNEDVEQSALVLIQGIAARLAAAGSDPAKLKALRDSLSTSADSLAAAVAENTPAATEPT